MNEVLALGYCCWYERYLENNFEFDFKQYAGSYRKTIFDGDEVVEDIKSELLTEFYCAVSIDRENKPIRKTKKKEQDDKRCKPYQPIRHPVTYYRRMLGKLLRSIINKRIKNYRKYRQMTSDIAEQLNNTKYFDDHSVFEFKDIINASGLTMNEQNVINSYFINDHSLRQIAEKSKTEYETVKKRFQRAKAKIKKVLINLH